MKRTQVNHLRGVSKQDYRILLDMSCRTREIYNYSLSVVNDLRDAKAKVPSYNKLYHLIKHNIDYKIMPTHVAQQTVRSLSSNISAFFELLKLKNNGGYDKKVRFPGPKIQVYDSIIFPNSYFQIQSNKIRLSLGRNLAKIHNKQFIYINFPRNLKGKKINQIRLNPGCNGNYFNIEYVYDQAPIKLDLDKMRLLAIDFGINNTATTIDSDGYSILIDGKRIKSHNRLYNKNNGKYDSKYKQQGYNGGRMKEQNRHKRENVVNDHLNKTVSTLVKRCIAHNFGTVVFGNAPILMKPYLPEFRDRRITQNFNYIPFRRLVNKLISKCEIYGIEVQEVDETGSSIICSNCSFIDNKNRLTRGHLNCRICSYHQHADVNAAINIARQVSPSFLLGSSGHMVRPVRIRF